jgi:DNA-binding Lrp family transcriptional regulator
MERHAMSTTAKTPSWRDILKIHPAAELFPLMAPGELKELGEDIRKHGLKIPTIWWRDPTTHQLYLLDGRNRLDAMEAMGRNIITGCDGTRPDADLREILTRGFEHGYELPASGPRGVNYPDPYAYVISANIHRRHLTVEDKNRLIVELLKADPKKSNRQVAKLTKTSHPHVAKVREEAEKAGDVETVTTSIDTKGRKQPASKPRKAEKKSDHRVTRRPTVGETLIDELLNKPKPPRRPARKKWEIIHERQALVQRLVAVDRELVVLLSKFFGKYPDQINAFFADVSICARELEDSDGDAAARAAEPEASAEAMKAKFAEIDDGLDIPESLRRAP